MFAGVTHEVSSWQVVWHCDCETPSHRKAPQSLVVPGAQLPAPSQNRADVAIEVPAGQEAGWHCVELS